jgi:hypothetical protein
MADEEEQLIEEARKSREETEKLRKESDSELSGEPWAKTSSGDKDEITDDDRSFAAAPDMSGRGPERLE